MSRVYLDSLEQTMFRRLGFGHLMTQPADIVYQMVAASMFAKNDTTPAAEAFRQAYNARKQPDFSDRLAASIATIKATRR